MNSKRDFVYYILIYFPISSINLNNYNNPYNISIGVYYYFLNLTQFKTILFSYSIDEINTESSYIGSIKRKDIILS